MYYKYRLFKHTICSALLLVMSTLALSCYGTENQNMSMFSEQLLFINRYVLSENIRDNFIRCIISTKHNTSPEKQKDIYYVHSTECTLFDKNNTMYNVTYDNKNIKETIISELVTKNSVEFNYANNNNARFSYDDIKISPDEALQNAANYLDKLNIRNDHIIMVSLILEIQDDNIKVTTKNPTWNIIYIIREGRNIILKVDAVDGTVYQ